MIYVSTHAGKRHTMSEDSVLVGTEVISDESAIFPMPDAGFICIADGVGGNYGGAQASSFILNALAKWEDDPVEDTRFFWLSAIMTLLLLHQKTVMLLRWQPL